MARRAASGCVSQAVAHLHELLDRRVDLVGLRGERTPIDVRASIRAEHERDLLERESRGSAEPDERELLEHVGLEQTVQPSPADRLDEAFLLVETKRRRGDARSPRHLGDVQA